MAAIVTCQEIEKKLGADLDASLVRATDLSDGCGSKFDILIVSSAFEGKKEEEIDDHHTYYWRIVRLNLLLPPYI